MVHLEYHEAQCYYLISLSKIYLCNKVSKKKAYKKFAHLASGNASLIERTVSSIIDWHVRLIISFVRSSSIPDRPPQSRFWLNAAASSQCAGSAPQYLQHLSRNQSHGLHQVRLNNLWSMCLVFNSLLCDSWALSLSRGGNMPDWERKPAQVNATKRRG